MRISFDSHESINLCLPKLKTQSTLEKIYFYMNLIYLYRKNIYRIYYRNE